MREYLKKLRVENNMTMQAVADAFGISKQYYEMIESGERQKKMDITIIDKVSRLFNVPFETIVEEEKRLLTGEEETA